MTSKPVTTTKKRPGRATRLSLAVGAIISVALGDLAHAVVLGNVHVQSRLGQPLVAEVELLDGDHDTLKARLASPTTHQRHSFSAPSQLGGVSVRVVQKRNGQRVLRVTSERVVNEPTVEMLIEAEDRNGSLVRYMPLLIDPTPVGQTPPQTAVRAERTPLAEAAEPQPVTKRPRRTARQETTRVARDEQRATAPARKPRRAAAAAPDPALTSRNEAPPTATVPSASASPTSVPRPSRDELLAPVPSTPTTARDTATALPAAPAISAPSTGAAMAPAAPAQVRSAPATLPLPELGALASASNPEAAAPLSRSSAATEPAPLGAPVTPGSASVAEVPPADAPTRRTVPSVVASSWAASDYLLAGSSVALLGGLALFGLRRRRRPATPSLDLPSGQSVGPMIFGADDRASSRMGAASRRRNTKLPAGLNTNVFSPSSFHMMEEVDPVAEADVYIAYGRVDHAKAILEDAVRIHPERAALHLKLLSIHFDQRDGLVFNERAQALLTLTGGRGPEWQEVRAMGRQLDPTNPLYQAAQPPMATKATDKSVDLDITKPVDALEHPTTQPVSLAPAPSTGDMAPAPSAAPMKLAAPAFGKSGASDAFWKSTWSPTGASAVDPGAPRPLFPDSDQIEFTISVTPDDLGQPRGTPDVAVSKVDLPLNFEDFHATMPQPVEPKLADTAWVSADAKVQPGPQKLDLELIDLTDAPTAARDTGSKTPQAVPATSIKAAKEPPEQRKVAQTPSKPAPKAAAAATMVAAAPTLAPSVKPRGQAANASQFDTLPARLALVQELTHRGDQREAARVAQEVADLIAQLRLEASSIVSAVSRRA